MSKYIGSFDEIIEVKSMKSTIERQRKQIEELENQLNKISKYILDDFMNEDVDIFGQIDTLRYRANKALADKAELEKKLERLKTAAWNALRFVPAIHRWGSCVGHTVDEHKELLNALQDIEKVNK